VINDDTKNESSTAVAVSAGKGTAADLQLPWRLIQEDVRPFALHIEAADGSIAVHEDRWARSSSDRTISEAMNAVHFGPEDRAEAADGNAKQLAKLAFIVKACNSHDELVAFVRDVAGHDPVFAKGAEKQRIEAARALLSKTGG
jgi:hypothetical protein